MVRDHRSLIQAIPDKVKTLRLDQVEMSERYRSGVLRELARG